MFLCRNVYDCKTKRLCRPSQLLNNSAKHIAAQTAAQNKAQQQTASSSVPDLTGTGKVDPRTRMPDHMDVDTLSSILPNLIPDKFGGNCNSLPFNQPAVDGFATQTDADIEAYSPLLPSPTLVIDLNPSAHGATESSAAILQPCSTPQKSSLLVQPHVSKLLSDSISTPRKRSVQQPLCTKLPSTAVTVIPKLNGQTANLPGFVDGTLSVLHNCQYATTNCCWDNRSTAPAHLTGGPWNSSAGAGITESSSMLLDTSADLSVNWAEHGEQIALSLDCGRAVGEDRLTAPTPNPGVVGYAQPAPLFDAPTAISGVITVQPPSHEAVDNTPPRLAIL